MDELINKINIEKNKMLNTINLNMKHYSIDEVEIIEYMKLYDNDDYDEEKQAYMLSLGYI